ncbi:M23 family metallopeptidase [Corynebacterium sp. A21]|uniref:M23 family metallopeptidase n=1 Tax=Corynebacterium sp. A21 TaxID=3457318 RepID=UPI003FD5D97E
MQANGGRHRKIGISPAKRRVALVAVAAGTVSTAGVGGAAAGTLHSQASTASTEAEKLDLELATDHSALSSELATAAPQILNIEEFKPVTNLDEQVKTALHVNEVKAAEYRSGDITKPTEGTFTSGFEMRWGTMHKGVDIANAIGTPIMAALAGTVIDAGPASGFGNWVRVQHDDGSIAVYGHMATIDVAVGQRVTAGQQIAGMGNEGFSTGSHLHFEIYPDGVNAIDPLPWLAERGIVL